MIVHLTNGTYFNNWWMKQNGCLAVSFNEAMMSGPVNENPFDDEFVSLRAQYHHVSEEDYLKNMQPFLDVINQLDQIDELILWFGVDVFCQMNLLTIYHALKQKDYHGVIKAVLFDENEPWEKILSQQPVKVNWEAMADLYQEVLMERNSVCIDDEIMNHAIALYLDLHNDNGRLNQLIRQYPSMNEKELVKVMMEHSKEEGLSDVQALEMIRKVRKNEMKRGLFVIDYQNDFVDGALGFAGAELLDEKIASKVREYGEDCVWYTRDTHFENYLETREGKNLPIVHCVKGTHGWQVYGETAVALNEVNAKAIDKLVFGMDVTDSATAAVLPESLDEIELVGLVSNICVVSNAVVLQAKYPEATIVVDASCTASFDKELHEKVLDVLEGFQVKVIHR